MKRFWALSLLVIALLLIETSILSSWYILPLVPDLLLLALVYIGFHNGSLTGESVGFASGFLLDLLSAAPLGFNALVRTIIGFLSGLFFQTINTTGIFVPILLGLSATLSKALIVWVISFFYPSGIVTYSLFSSILWYECALNALLSPIVFWILSCFSIMSSDFSMEKLS